MSVLKQIHNKLHLAVFEAHGWRAGLTNEQILEKLVALNAERAAEETRGLIRWLRPGFGVAQKRAANRNRALRGDAAPDGGRWGSGAIPYRY